MVILVKLPKDAGFASSTWLSNPDATLEELAQTATAIGVEITPEAVFQRFTPNASQFLKRVLDSSIKQVISANPVAIEYASLVQSHLHGGADVLRL